MIFFSVAVLALEAFLTLLAAGLLVFTVYATLVGFAMGAPYVRSKKEKIAAMMALAEISSHDMVVDLGSGDGSLVIAAAASGAAAAVGVEMNPLLVWYSRMRIRRARLASRARIVRGNFFDFPLAGADVVLMYLWPSTVEKLGEKMKQELKSGARVVSSAFPIAGWMPERIEKNVFVYEIDRQHAPSDQWHGTRNE